VKYIFLQFANLFKVGLDIPKFCTLLPVSTALVTVRQFLGGGGEGNSDFIRSDYFLSTGFATFMLVFLLIFKIIFGTI